jgi:hypothetical protein
MNITTSRDNDHLLYWIAALLLLIGVGLGDTVVIAWCASLVSVWQLAVSAFSFVLIGGGVLFTAWQMRR